MNPDSAHRQSALRAGTQVLRSGCATSTHGHSHGFRGSSFSARPLINLLAQHTTFPGYWRPSWPTAAPPYAFKPHYCAHSREHRPTAESFWNEIYETVLSPYILLPTMMASQSQAGQVQRDGQGRRGQAHFFDSRIAQPSSDAGVQLLRGCSSPFRASSSGIAPAGHGAHERAVVRIQCRHLGVCIAVAREMRQLRTTVRINVVSPVLARLPDGGYCG